MLRSRLTAGALALALALAVPAGAGASPLRWLDPALDPGNLWAAAWQRLAAFWGEEGPAGTRESRGPGITSAWAEQGIGMDPDGAPAPPAAAAAPLPPPPR